MKLRKKPLARVGLLGLAALAVPVVGIGQVVFGVGPASADYAPQTGDIVGVGGDTPQYAVDFAINGDTHTGDFGFNEATGGVNKVTYFDATADANGRQAYAQGSTEASPIPLNPTDVLRAGDAPVQRVQSSGAAISALLADTGGTTINFVASASLPTAAQQSQAATNGWTYLHVVQIATDSVQIAADSSSTNAPAGLSAADLLGIYDGTYTTWNQLPGNSGGSGATIIPELPPTGSSINKTFLADLRTANGGTAPVLAGDVVTVEQNDPTAITGASSPANAIVPFSKGRSNLYNAADWFYNPATVFPGGGTALSSGISLLTGSVPGGGSYYNSAITDYIIFRQSDASSATPLEPGGSLNWVNALFSDPGSPTTAWFDSSEGQTLLNDSGVTASYNDLGDVHS